MVKTLCLFILSIVFYSCVFNCDTYLNKEIKPLFINGVVINKSEKNCFGEIILRNKNKIDTLKDICVCTSENEGLWHYVTSGDSVYKKKNNLVIMVIRNDSVKTFDYPCCSE